MIQRTLVLVLLLSMIGTAAELLLLGHTEDLWQWEPLGVFALGLVTLMWHVRAGTILSHRVCLTAMALMVLSGVVGTLLHYRGNVEFELEMVPGLAGWALFREAMTGATPVLAPGAMIPLGLVGLLYTLISRERTTTETSL
jgi:hypothetical protein